MYFYFGKKTKVERTLEINDFVNVDYDSKGMVIGVEILDCKKYTLQIEIPR